MSRKRQHRKHCFQQFLYCCVPIDCRGHKFVGRYLATAFSSGPTISVFQLPYHNIIHSPTSSLPSGHFLTTALKAFLIPTIRAAHHRDLIFLESVVLIIFVKSTIHGSCHYNLSLSLCLFYLSLSLSVSCLHILFSALVSDNVHLYTTLRVRMHIPCANNTKKNLLFLY